MATAFEFYLRSGRARSATEFKFNPWHDPEDGRFTFAGQGRHFAGGFRPGGPGIRGRDREGREVRGDDTARLSGRTAARRRTDPKDPRNHSLYTVKRGDSLTKIARLRNGLTAADLAWLNGLNADRPLQVGQSIKLPHQQFLDAGKRARGAFLTLAAYMDATGGKLPPDVAHPPSIAAQIEASGVREVRKNGYVYDVDMLLRPRRAAGELRLQSRPRSRSAQANAGKPDRRSTDDGGHYIAARFNGPREWFNHFAQDSNFNRGGYRALEDEWAKAVRAGRRVLVDITPYYRGTSRRPYKLTIVWIVDGHRRSRDFQNERGGR